MRPRGWRVHVVQVLARAAASESLRGRVIALVAWVTLLLTRHVLGSGPVWDVVSARLGGRVDGSAGAWSRDRRMC